MSPTENDARTLLARLRAEFASKPFVPHRVLSQRDLQTLAAYFWPGRYQARDVTGDERRLFEVEPGTKVLACCRWQDNRTEHATLVMWHGIEGSSASAYMLSTAAKAFRAGLNVIRMNVRSCGGTDHLTPTLYHGGMSGDARAVLEELIGRDRLSRIIIAGFSLGGNKVLKLAGEYGKTSPAELVAVATISPSVSLRASSDRLMARRNVIYHKDFLYYLKRRIKVKEKLFPDLYQANGLSHIHTLRQFDDAYIAPAFGFADADDYYAKASSLPHIKDIRIPTLIVHAQDDPFVPFAPLRDPSVDANANILLIAPERGGHVAFISANSNETGEDRFWAENRLIDFCRTVAG
ncbi:MAG TPA: alpha/beta fold hydrolase [Pyrinomonadaceae bacterium]|jgi:predicted alpha/beta-fold hydrolase|nr:alpha/beta fold hydrolase [Pyrinomonadaceae bacterium]